MHRYTSKDYAVKYKILFFGGKASGALRERENARGGKIRGGGIKAPLNQNKLQVQKSFELRIFVRIFLGLRKFFKIIF